MQLTCSECESPIQTFKQVLGYVELIKFKCRQDELLNLLLLQEEFTFILFNTLEHTKMYKCQHIKGCTLNDRLKLLQQNVLTISAAVRSLLKYLKFTSNLLNTYWGTLEFGSFFFNSAVKCRISFIIISRWSEAHSELLLTTSCIILFNLVIMSCYSNSSIDISREATIALTILTVNALNFA